MDWHCAHTNRHIHSRVEQFLCFSPVQQKKKNSNYVQLLGFFPELPWAGQFRIFFVSFFLIFLLAPTLLTMLSLL